MIQLMVKTKTSQEAKLVEDFVRNLGLEVTKIEEDIQNKVPNKAPITYSLAGIFAKDKTSEMNDKEAKMDYLTQKHL
jgi:hypothetical protein